MHCFALRYSSTQSGDNGLEHHPSGNVESSKIVRVCQNSTHVLPQSVQLGVELGLEVGQGKVPVFCELTAQMMGARD